MSQAPAKVLSCKYMVFRLDSLKMKKPFSGFKELNFSHSIEMPQKNRRTDSWCRDFWI